MGIVVTDEAVDAAKEAWTNWKGGYRDGMRAAIEAALPHLTDAGQPLGEPVNADFDPTDYEVRAEVLRNAVAFEASRRGEARFVIATARRFKLYLDSGE